MMTHGCGVPRHSLQTTQAMATARVLRSCAEVLTPPSSGRAGGRRRAAWSRGHPHVEENGAPDFNGQAGRSATATPDV